MSDVEIGPVTQAELAKERAQALELGLGIMEQEMTRLETENEYLIGLIDRLDEALRLTQEYVGSNTLPPAEGWAWFDAREEVRLWRDHGRD